MVPRKRYGQLENSGASPSFSCGYNSRSQHRKVSIGVTIKEALAVVDCEIFKKGQTSDAQAGDPVSRKNLQDDIGQSKWKNGHVQSSIQKAGEWVSHSFHKDSRTVEVNAKRKSVMQSKEGLAEKVDCDTYARKSKDDIDLGNVEEFAFSATKEVLSKKNKSNCTMVTQENGYVQTNQRTESLRMKLWDVLRTVPSQQEDGKDPSAGKSKQNSGTTNTDSGKPIQNGSKPITHSALERKPTNELLKLQNELHVHQKLPQQNVFAFTSEDIHGSKPVAVKKSIGFKRKQRKKCNLIEPQQMQYSPETVAEKKQENAAKEKLKSASTIQSLPSSQEGLNDKGLGSSAKEVKDVARRDFDIPFVTNGKGKEHNDNTSNSNKVAKGSSIYTYNVKGFENSPVAKATATDGGFQTSSKCSGDKKQLEKSATKKESFHSSRKCDGDQEQLEMSETKKESLHYSRRCVRDKEKLGMGEAKEESLHNSRKCDEDKEKLETAANKKERFCNSNESNEDREALETGGSREENFQSPPLHDDNIGHASPELPKNMTIAQGFHRGWRRPHEYDDTTKDKGTLCRTPPVQGRINIDKNFLPSEEGQNIKCPQQNQMSKREKWIPESREKPLFLLRRSIRTRRQVNEVVPTSILPSPTRNEEHLLLHVESQQSEDALARTIGQFASGLDKFKTKLKSHTKRKASDILSSTTGKVQVQLQDVESQIKMELEKLAFLCSTKRKGLETRFQEQQESLQKIHAKFKEDVSLHLQECTNVLGEMKADQIDLRAIAERQKASHRKLLSQVQEEIVAQLGDAERRIAALNKEASGQMQQLKRALSGLF